MIAPATPIACPKCGGGYLHHGLVKSFVRGEDDPAVVLTQVHGGGAVSMDTVANRAAGNPSSRRGAVVIKFDCEGCDAEPELQIVQHKGNTYLSWRGDLPVTSCGRL